MKYETIGGKIKDTQDNVVLLRYLKIGDRFKTKSSKDIFEVRGEKCVYSEIGSPTRRCKNLTSGGVEHKLCRIEVTKLHPEN